MSPSLFLPALCSGVKNQHNAATRATHANLTRAALRAAASIDVWRPPNAYRRVVVQHVQENVLSVEMLTVDGPTRVMGPPGFAPSKTAFASPETMPTVEQHVSARHWGVVILQMVNALLMMNKPVWTQRPVATKDSLLVCEVAN